MADLGHSRISGPFGRARHAFADARLAGARGDGSFPATVQPAGVCPRFTTGDTLPRNCSDLKGLPSLSVSPEWPAALGGLNRRAVPAVVCAPRYAPLKAAALLGVNGLPWGWHEEDRRSATLNSYTASEALDSSLTLARQSSEEKTNPRRDFRRGLSRRPASISTRRSPKHLGQPGTDKSFPS